MPKTPEDKDGRDNSVSEELLRRDLCFELLDRIWKQAALEEDKAMKLAVKAQHATRRRAS
jgi:hypothetical protein